LGQPRAVLGEPRACSSRVEVKRSACRRAQQPAAEEVRGIAAAPGVAQQSSRKSASDQGLLPTSRYPVRGGLETKTAQMLLQTAESCRKCPSLILMLDWSFASSPRALDVHLRRTMQLSNDIRYATQMLTRSSASILSTVHAIGAPLIHHVRLRHFCLASCAYKYTIQSAEQRGRPKILLLPER
jgi:hypothetical protein